MFDKPLYNRLLNWARGKVGGVYLSNYDVIHDTWLHCYDRGVEFNEDNCKKIAQKILNTETRETLAKVRIINGRYFIIDKTIHILSDEKICIYCKISKPVTEFDLFKGKYPREYCRGCRKHHKKRYYKPAYRFVDISTGKKYTSLVKACEELGLKYSAVKNSMFRKNRINKTSIRKL